MLNKDVLVLTLLGGGDDSYIHGHPHSRIPGRTWEATEEVQAHMDLFGAVR